MSTRRDTTVSASATSAAGSVMLMGFMELSIGDALTVDGRRLEIDGGPGDDEWSLSRSADGGLLAASPAEQATLFGVDSVVYDGGGGGDQFDINFDSGDPLGDGGGGIEFLGGEGVNELSVSGASITDINVYDGGRTGTLRADGRMVTFSGLPENWLGLSSMAISSPTYIVDEAPDGTPQAVIPIEGESGSGASLQETSFAVDAFFSPSGNPSDTVEFWVVEAGNPTNVLVGGASGEPLLSLTDDNAVTAPGLARFAGNRLHVDTSGVPTGMAAELLVTISDADGLPDTNVEVQPLANDFENEILLSEIGAFDPSSLGAVFLAEWLDGTGDFDEIGLVRVDDASGAIDGVLPGQLGYAQMLSSSPQRLPLFNDNEAVGATAEVTLDTPGLVAIYVSHSNPDATDPEDHIAVTAVGDGVWAIGWEESQSIFPGIGSDFDDAVIRLTAQADCSPLLLAGTGEQRGGGDIPGTAISDGCFVTLVEGDSFDVDWTSPIAIPDSGSLSFSFSNLVFDTTDEDFVNDAFEVALLDENGKSLVRTIDPGRDAFFNVTEDLGIETAEGVIVDGDTVTIGLGGLVPGDTGYVVFRLVNNDDDVTTTVRIESLEVLPDAIESVAPGGAGVVEQSQVVGSLDGVAETSTSVTIPSDDVLAGLLPGGDSSLDLAPVDPDDSLLGDDNRIEFTTTADFDQGTLFNVSTGDVLGSISLNPASDTERFPYLWIPSTTDGTISRIDVRTGEEVARHRLGAESIASGLFPNRLSIDGDGSVWVVNRHIGSTAAPNTVVHVLDGDQFIDRNANGVVDTSTDLNGDGRISANELMPWDGNNDGQPDDERIALVLNVGRSRDNPDQLLNRTQPNAAAVDANGDVWVGSWLRQQYEVYDRDTGNLKEIVPTGIGNYGAVIDGNGILYSTTRAGSLVRIDTGTRQLLPSIPVDGNTFSSIIDPNGVVWTSAAPGKIHRYDPATGDSDVYADPQGGNDMRGIAVDEENNIWVASTQRNAAVRFSFDTDGKTLLSVDSVPVGVSPYGASLDADGNVWITTTGDNRATKIDPATQTIVDGWPIDTWGNPYIYADLSGFSRQVNTVRTGTWTEIIDAERSSAVWASLAVAATTPDPSVVRKRVRAADDRNALAGAEWVDLVDTDSLLGVRGRYLEVEVALESTDRDVNPSIESITVSSVPAPAVSIATPTQGDTLPDLTTLLSGTAVAGQADNGDGVAVANEIINVTVNGVAVELLDAGGNYFEQVGVQPGINRFEVVATDRFGQTGSATVAVFGGEPPAEIDFSQFADITGSFSGIYGRTSLNEDDAKLYVDLAIRNDGAFDADAPLLIGVTNISDPTVSVQRPDGFTPEGIPYFNYSDVATGGRLAPSELTEFPTITFDTPSRERFDYDLVFFGKLNQPPEITTLPDIEALADRPYVYDVDAIDPDDDPVSFSLLAAPAGMAIDATTGVITWAPTANDIGDYDVLVEATDGRGGVATQRYTLSVIAPPPNRPPVIVSTPVTVALPSKEVSSEEVDIDLRTWVETPILGTTDDADWVVADDGLSVKQFLNANASVFLSDFTVSDDRIRGTWRVEDTGLGLGGARDDDFMGFVFGYQDEGHFYLFDWKKDPQTVSGGARGLRGMSLKVVETDTPLTGFDLWNSAGSGDRVRVLAGANNIPWRNFTDYDFDLKFTSGRITITVSDMNGVVATIDVEDDTYTDGGFGFYNNSQGEVAYRGFTREELLAPTYEYDVNAIDPDDDVLTYSLVDGEFPDGMVINPDSGVIRWGPTLDQVGEHDVLVRVEDGRGGVAEQAYTVVVKGDPANNPPVFVSTPVTTFQSPGAVNPTQGNVTPTELRLDAPGPTTFTETVSITIPDDGGGDGTADIIFVVDESGSMAGEHAWIAGLINTVDASLQAEGVFNNRYGLVGYADTGRTLQSGGDSFMTASNFVSAAGLLSTNRSGAEDGYRGIDYALDNYTFRDEAAKAIILVTDEHRTTTDGSLNFANTSAALQAENVFLALVGNANLSDIASADALGVAADGQAYVDDTMGGFTVSTGGVFVGSDPVPGGDIANIKADYVDLAWGVGGVTWNLNFLRDGGQAADVFSEVFVDVLAADIVRQLPIDIVTSDPSVNFTNLTGVLSDIGPGETATFDVEFTGDGPNAFDLTFVRPDTGAILGSIPVNRRRRLPVRRPGARRRPRHVNVLDRRRTGGHDDRLGDRRAHLGRHR